MKQKEDNILNEIGRRDGLTVPPGFFEEFARNVEANLPENPDAERTAKPVTPQTMWERMRPFVYMAAMFAGIWCMLKMFTMMGGRQVDFSVGDNKILTEALSDENFIYDHLIDEINEQELFDQMYDDSIDVGDFVPLDIDE